MILQSPLALLALVLLPLVAWAYLRGEARRAARAEAFASGPVADSVAPRRPGWRRHVAPVFLLLALTALIVAAARPTATVSKSTKRASVLLVTDRSGSMQADDVPGGRMAAAQRAGGLFLDQLPRGVRAGLIAFNHDVQVLQPPTADTRAVRRALASLTPAGSTAAGDALLAGIKLLRPTGQPKIPAAIVLLSDGKSVRGSDPLAAADEAKRQGIKISTIALGTDAGELRTTRRDGSMRVQQVPPDRETLKAIAERSGGQAFSAATPAQLDAIYRRLGRQTTTTRAREEITVWFAGAALALLLVGGTAGLALTGRPV